jgi:hypothetical protein
MLCLREREWLDSRRALDDPEEFVGFWSRLYRYPNQHLYDDNVGKELTVERVWKLFAWKNGRGESIAPKKRRSIEENYLPELNRLPNLSQIEDGRRYLAGLQGGAIWGIFWLHLINHKLFPIFDQNTYRSMAKITGNERAEIPLYNPTKVEAYFRHYIPFLTTFNGLDERTVDKALFAYGQALRRRSKEVKNSN